jgi:hypothetical protein
LIKRYATLGFRNKLVTIPSITRRGIDRVATTREDRSMIERLDHLLALAREKHFGRAAEACGVSQPTLSASIRQLEEQFGAPLVVQIGRAHV